MYPLYRKPVIALETSYIKITKINKCRFELHTSYRIDGIRYINPIHNLATLTAYKTTLNTRLDSIKTVTNLYCLK